MSGALPSQSSIHFREAAILAADQAAHERHFCKRARQRFGIHVSPARYREWCRCVEQVGPGVRFLGPGEAPGRTAWLLEVAGFRMNVIFDERTERLVTCLYFGRDKHCRLRALDRDGREKRRRLARHHKPWKS